jgi:serine/threonine protein kinase
MLDDIARIAANARCARRAVVGVEHDLDADVGGRVTRDLPMNDSRVRSIPAVVTAPARPYGAFLLCEELGRGGMAVVHRAISQRPESLGRVVALKQLLTTNQFDTDFDQVRSLIEEARLARRFRHPNIARTYSLGKADGRYFIEMEYVAGRSLFQIAQQSERTGAVPIAFVAQILIQICGALEHVHGMCDDRGVPLALVHRDVSLSNIIVGDDGIAKLIDFGIVKGHSCTQTKTGLIKGKVAYVAPEYLAGTLDRRADLFALGVIAHELLTGRRLFLGTSDLDTITRVQQLRVPLPSRSRPEVSPALDAIVMRALERDPAKRWQTAADMRAALVAVYGDDPAVVREWLPQAFVERPVPTFSQLLRVIDSLEDTAEIVPETVREPVARGRGHAFLLAALVCGLSSLALAASYAAS